MNQPLSICRKLCLCTTPAAVMTGSIRRTARLRAAAGWGLALYALCVWPANINHFIMDMARPDGGLGLAYHVPRMIAQPVIIWLAILVSRTNKTARDL